MKTKFLEVDESGYERYGVGANYYMAYHTVLKTSKDYYEALRNARAMAKNITNTINTQLENIKVTERVEVFPYRWGL